jgi:riboflavin synthase alpha subunit
MFTGIVEETGIVRSFEELDQAWRLDEKQTKGKKDNSNKTRY